VLRGLLKESFLGIALVNADLKLIHPYLIDMRDGAPRREGRRPDRKALKNMLKRELEERR